MVNSNGPYTSDDFDWDGVSVDMRTPCLSFLIAGPRVVELTEHIFSYIYLDAGQLAFFSPPLFLRVFIIEGWRVAVDDIKLRCFPGFFLPLFPHLS